MVREPAAVPSGSGRFPSLDGLRAISIALVLVSHILGTTGFPWGPRALGAAGDLGYLGVRVFFVISGFLITTLILRDEAKRGRISLTNFYMRRVYRILPAFLTFVAVMMLAAWLGQIDLVERDLIHAVTFTMNYHYERSWELGHLWSLSIEEQFYLLWPLLLVVATTRRTIALSIAMIALAPLCRIAAWYGAPEGDFIMEGYPCVMDSIAAGCLLAAARPWLDGQAGYLRFLGSRWFWLVPLAVILAQLPGRAAFDYVTDISLMNLGIAVSIDRFVRLPNTLSGRVLNLAPLAWLGALSYSLYLWQEPFLDPKDHHVWTQWPLNLGLAVGCAILSYYAIERPVLRWRQRRDQARPA